MTTTPPGRRPVPEALEGPNAITKPPRRPVPEALEGPNAITRPAVRSSPLEAVHARLGARWRAPDLRWPVDYVKPAAEAEAVRSAAGLLDWGPLSKLLVQGPMTSEALRAFSPGFEPGAVAITTLAAQGLASQVWGLAPDEALVLTALGAAPPPIAAGRATVVDLSSAYVALVIVGPNARKVLAELCPADLAPRAIPDLRIVHTPVANVRVTLARQDLAGLPRFTLLTPRDYAAYLWEALMHSGSRHGLSPVGNLFLEGA